MNTTNSYLLSVQEMKSSAGFKCLKWPPSSHPAPPSSALLSEAPWRMSATGLPFGRVPLPPSTLPLNKSCDMPCLSRGASWVSLSKPLLPRHIPLNAAVVLSGRLGLLSPRGKHLPHKVPKSFVPQSISGEYLKAPEVGGALWCLYWPASFPFFFFFFNNQGSRKCGELTAWQQQRNSLGKLRCSLLRFQPLRQESQRNNRLLVVFNHSFCGTFLVQETNLSVQHGGAWERNRQTMVWIRGLPQWHLTGPFNLSLMGWDLSRQGLVTTFT